MARTRLQRFAIVHQRFNRVSSFCACKFFLICLTSTNHWHCQYFLTEICIQIQHLLCTFFGFLCSCMRCMTFLPQKFSGAEEWSCLFFPTYHRTPLVVQLWKITVRLNFILIKVTEKRLRRRTYTKSFLQWVETAIRYPCNFRCKSLHMILFSFEKTFWNKHWHIYIFHACLFKSTIQFMLDILPDRVTCRFKNHASLYAGISHQFCFFNNIRIPLCEVNIHRCNGFY